MSQPLSAQPYPSISQRSEERAAETARVGSTAQPVASAPGRRPRWTTLAFLAVTAGVAAIGLGGWVLISERNGSQHADAVRSSALEKAAFVLADPQAQRIPLAGSVGRIVLLVAERGDGVLVLHGLGVAPAGRTYQAWVKLPGSGEISSAGTFDGAEPFVPLTQWVTPGVRVSVTLEAEDGAKKPSRAARLTALRRLTS